jgi:5-methylcytosine-specific restriction endonuclease McrA
VTTRRRSTAARMLLFGGSLMAGAAAWTGLREAGGWEGGLSAVLLAELVLPGWALCLTVMPGVVRQAIVPRSIRIKRRKAARIGGLRRPPIPARLKRTLMGAYRHRCVFCKRRTAGPLQLEHIRPWSLGGLTWFLNMTLLCVPCNEAKLSYWKERNGWEADGHGRVNKGLARRILRAERRARRNPFMWWRAAWAWF